MLWRVLVTRVFTLFYQSEKRAQELWAQLAIEERRCLDLVKFVKEMLPVSGSQKLKNVSFDPYTCSCYCCWLSMNLMFYDFSNFGHGWIFCPVMAFFAFVHFNRGSQQNLSSIFIVP